MTDQKIEKNLKPKKEKFNPTFAVMSEGMRRVNVEGLWKALYNSGRNNTVLSWGVHRPVNVHGYALRFNVQGFLHRGYVYIQCDGLDNLVVTCTTNRNTICKRATGVNIENLISIIDCLVEKDTDQKTYDSQVDKFFKSGVWLQ